jgi:hypothetical protein
MDEVVIATPAIPVLAQCPVMEKVMVGSRVGGQSVDVKRSAR